MLLEQRMIIILSYKLIRYAITIGVYNDMLYIQPSDVFFENRVAQDDDDDDNADDGKQVQVYMPRVRWKPYIATGNYDNDIRNIISY